MTYRYYFTKSKHSIFQLINEQQPFNKNNVRTIYLVHYKYEI